ncbi:L-seryl-tRNA(Sec) kinase [Nymphon striatum]|nr:L-seryl-tRNA(Sec) kinase [Nymphon striatum]
MKVLGCVAVLAGLPGSGKTSLCQKICSEVKVIDNHPTRVIHICYDHIITFSKAGADENTSENLHIEEWKTQRKKIEKLAHNILNKIAGYVFDDDIECELAHYLINYEANEKSIVVLLLDDNMYYNSMRYEWYQFARNYELGFCQIYLNSPLEICLARNNKRLGKARVDKEILCKMWHRFEEPRPSKNKWENFSKCVTVEDTEQGDKLIMEIQDLFGTCIKYPVLPTPDNEEEKKISRTICSNSIIHQSDKILRKLIGEVIQNSRKSTPTEKGTSVSKLLEGEAIVSKSYCVINFSAVWLYFLLKCLIKPNFFTPIPADEWSFSSLMSL